MTGIETTLLRFVTEDLLAGQGVEVGVQDEIVLNGTVDSLGVVRLISFIEDELDVAVPAEDVTIENFRSIATIAGYLQGLLESGSAA